MDRRSLLKVAAALPFARGLLVGSASATAAGAPFSRVRPGDPAWPSDGSWQELNRRVEGRLIKVNFPLSVCIGAPPSEACSAVFEELKNPYYLGDEVGLTQSLGWIGAWTSRPSVYAVAAESTADVVAAVNFARTHNLRLVVKGGGHSYQGTSNAADSLLIWTRRMNAVTLHEAFVGTGCEGRVEPQAAVSVGPGAIWGHTYNEVTTKGGRYVQGGGCMTVGVAGLVLGGGFGSFSKAYGLAGASLLEAEVVTADGAVRLANACSNPDLFWALKGGGGGFGILTRVTLRTQPLPDFFGGAFAAVNATSDDAYRRLVAKILEFYRDALFNPHWGEQIVLLPDRMLSIKMVSQGLTQQQAEAVWRPFFDWVSAAPQDFAIVSAPKIGALPARHFWDPSVLKKIPGLVLSDDRPGAPADNIYWAGNRGEAGVVWRAYQSAWLPAMLLEDDRRQSLADALTIAARHGVELHCNKGLAGASSDAIAAAKDTPMNPAVTDAFALAIGGAYEQPAYPGVPGHEPDVAAAKRDAAAVEAAMDAIRKLLPRVGSYVWETDYFQANWQDAFWGDNYARLRIVKDKYDPDGLFFLHHGVGSEDWSADGFTRLSAK
jgi:FAD/FMN-containing dehydrogenase